MRNTSKSRLAVFRRLSALVAACYDRSDTWKNLANAWLDAADGVPKVDGITHTTCSNNCEDLAEFLNLVRAR